MNDVQDTEGGRAREERSIRRDDGNETEYPGAYRIHSAGHMQGLPLILNEGQNTEREEMEGGKRDF